MVSWLWYFTHYVKSIFQMASALNVFIQAQVKTLSEVGPELVWACEAPSTPCGPLLAKPLLISLTTLAIFSTVIINHLSPLLSSPSLSSPLLSTLPPHPQPLFSSSYTIFSPLLCCLVLPRLCKSCSDEITPTGLMASML